MRKLFGLSLLVTAACYSATPDKPLNTPPAMQPPAMMQPAMQQPPADAKLPVIADFSASKLMVNPGETVDLSYQVTDADQVAIATDQGLVIMPWTMQLSGKAYPRALQETTSFIIQAQYKDKTVSKTITVTVDPMMANLTHAQVISFTANPPTVMPGAQATLSWKTMNASSAVVTQEGALVLTVASTDLAMGTYQVTPTQTSVYTIKAKGTDGQEITLTTAVNVGNGMGALTARQMFDQNVAPILQMKCSACHAGMMVTGPAFLGNSAANTAAYYTSLTADPRFMTTPPENSLLLLKGEHTGPAFCSPTEAAGTGSGRGCTPTTEQASVQAWLVQEGRERMGTMPMPTTGSQPRTLQEALTRFGACMTRSVWDQTYGVSQQTEVAYQNTTQGRCYACHSTGTAGSFLSQTSGDTFDNNRLMPDVLKLVQPTYNPDGTLKDLVPSNRWIDKGQEAALGGTHPTYNLSAARQQGLSSFLTQTLTKYHDYATPCGAPPATPPAGGGGGATPPPGGGTPPGGG